MTTHATKETHRDTQTRKAWYLRHRWLQLIGGAVLILAVLASCKPGPTVLSYQGATTLVPLVSEAAEVYTAAHPDIRIAITGGGSTAGILGAASGQSDLGGSAREITPQEALSVQATAVAIDALAVVVEASVPVEAVSRDELRRLYTGGRVAGFEGVDRIGKSPAHGTYHAFQAALGLGDTALTATAEAGSNGEMIAYVLASRGVGYVSLADAEAAIRAGDPLRILAVDGVMPGAASVTSGAYPLTRTLYLLLPRAGARAGVVPSRAARDFTSFLTGSEGAELVRAAGFLPVE